MMLVVSNRRVATPSCSHTCSDVLLVLTVTPACAFIPAHCHGCWRLTVTRDAGALPCSSVWSTPRDGQPALGEEELQQLETIFAAKPVSGAAAAVASAGKADAGPKKVALVDFKRAYNVSIALAQFKHFAAYSDIFRALYQVRVAQR
jgi:hypothetical protein